MASEPAHSTAWRPTANRNHFSCRRSVPADLRKRTARAPTAAKSASTVTTPDVVVSSWNSQPNCGHGPSTIEEPNISRLSDTQVTWAKKPKPSAHTIGLHRGDGSLPSGKRAGTRVKRKLKAGSHIHPRSQTANPEAGNT